MKQLKFTSLQWRKVTGVTVVTHTFDVTYEDAMQLTLSTGQIIYKTGASEPNINEVIKNLYPPKVDLIIGLSVFHDKEIEAAENLLRATLKNEINLVLI